MTPAGGARDGGDGSLGVAPGCHVVVAGAGVAGLTTALLLARDGHRVTVLERDRLTGPATGTGDGGAPDGGAPDGGGRGGPGAVPDPGPGTGVRRGTPQAHHSHAFLGRLRKLLAAELPDVLGALHAAGATDYQILDDLPETLEDRTPRPGDEDLVLLACRRTTFEQVLQRAAVAADGVTVRDGVAVDGLTTRPGDDGGPPQITGVRLRPDTSAGGSGTAGPGGSGGGEILAADVVVAAGGPRSRADEWLSDAGVAVPRTGAESGIVYLSRFYRHLSRAAPGGEGVLGLVGADIGYIKCAVFRGDNDTFSVTFAPRATDRELRSALQDPAGFDRACAQFDPIAPWVGPDRAEPLGDVRVMARLGNSQRRFLDGSGRPLVIGFHAVGDAHTSTNPLYGRGCTMAMVQASLLARALRDHPTSDRAGAEARSRAYEAATAAEIEPWYHVSVAQDALNEQAATAARRRAAAERGEGAPPSETEAGAAGEEDQDALVGQIIRDGLLPASRTDPVVARGFLRVVNALQTPESLMTDPDVTARIMRTMADPDARAVLPDFSVRRRDLLAAIHA